MADDDQHEQTWVPRLISDVRAPLAVMMMIPMLMTMVMIIDDEDGDPTWVPCLRSPTSHDNGDDDNDDDNES